MQPRVFREDPSSRRRWRRMIAFVIAFGATMLISVIALAIWDDVPQTTNELDWSEVPPVRIWTFLLILLGTPALTVLIAFTLPLPGGQALIVDAEGIRRQSKLMPANWLWRGIKGLELYTHPDGKSFIELAIDDEDADSRITDIYETPLAELFDHLVSVQSGVAGASAQRTDLAVDQAVAYDGDLQKQMTRPYSTFVIFLAFLFFVLHDVVEIPLALSIGVGVVALPVIVYMVVGIIRTLSSGGRRRLVLDESGLSIVAGGRQERIAWPDVGAIRVHGRTGFWATPRYIALETRQGRRGLLGSSRVVIPDAFLASMDEIADRLNGFRERLGQRQGSPGDG